jgi:cold-inducible RNA-binding protein
MTARFRTGLGSRQLPLRGRLGTLIPRGEGPPGSRSCEMSTKLFVGGLPWAMDNDRLKEVFAEFGDLEDARVILDRETGRSRGFGFVTYVNDESAEKALALNGQEVDGRRLRIDRAQEKERPARGGGGGRPSGPPGAGARPSDRGGPDRGRAPGAAPAPTGDRPSDRDRGAGGDRGRGGREGAAPRNFGDDWGGGGRDRGRRGKPADAAKGRSRRRGGRGARGGGGEGDGPPSGGFDDFDDFD